MPTVAVSAKAGDKYNRLKKTRAGATPWRRLMRHPAMWAIVVPPLANAVVLHLTSATILERKPYVIKHATVNTYGSKGDIIAITSEDE